MTKIFDDLNVNELNKQELVDTNGGIAIIAASLIGFAIGHLLGILTR